MPQPGDVFIYKQFPFEDGSRRDKWFVVLNTVEVESQCLVLKTTSQCNRYEGCSKGCNKGLKCFFAPISWQSCFVIDTYIQLPQIFQFSIAELLKGGFTKAIEFHSSLTSDCFAQLKSCLAGFKDDIPPLQWDMIYKPNKV